MVSTEMNVKKHNRAENKSIEHRLLKTLCLHNVEVVQDYFDFLNKYNMID